LEKEQLLYDLAVRRLEEQFRMIDALDLKTATIFTFSSVILPVAAAITVVDPKRINFVFIVAGGAAILVYGVLIFFLFRAYRIGTWDWRPNLSTLVQYVDDANVTRETLAEWIGTECQTSIAANFGRIKQKTEHFDMAICLFPFEAALLTLAAISLVF